MHQAGTLHATRRCPWTAAESREPDNCRYLGQLGMDVEPLSLTFPESELSLDLWTTYSLVMLTTLQEPR